MRRLPTFVLLFAVGAVQFACSSSGDSTNGDPLDQEPISSCSNGAKDEGETDVDCGGNLCKKCNDGAACSAGTDCVGGTCAAGVCTTPAGKPLITSFKAEKDKVTAGSGTNLTAVFSGGTGTIDNGVGAVTSGTAVPSGPLTKDTRFTLTVKAEDGAEVQQTVDVATVDAPAITSFTAADAKVSRYVGSTMLTAVFTGGTGEIDQSIGAVTSGVGVSTGVLPAPKTYTLTVTNPLGDTATATVMVDTKKEIIAANQGGSVTVFDEDASGDVAPKRQIAGATANVARASGVAVIGDELVVAVNGASAVSVFNITDDGDVAPKRKIAGASTLLNGPLGVFVSNGEIFVGDYGGSTVGVFNLTDDGDVAPKRAIAGATTTLAGACLPWVAGGELYVPNYDGGTVTVFDTTDNGDVAPKRTFSAPSVVGASIEGNELIAAGDGVIRVFDKDTVAAPIRTITGASTTIQFLYQCVVSGAELFCGDLEANKVFVFPVNGDGDIAPTRFIGGAATQLSQTSGVAIH